MHAQRPLDSFFARDKAQHGRDRGGEQAALPSFSASFAMNGLMEFASGHHRLPEAAPPQRERQQRQFAHHNQHRAELPTQQPQPQQQGKTFGCFNAVLLEPEQHSSPRHAPSVPFALREILGDDNNNKPRPQQHQHQHQQTLPAVFGASSELGWPETHFPHNQPMPDGPHAHAHPRKRSLSGAPEDDVGRRVRQRSPPVCQPGCCKHCGRQFASMHDLRRHRCSEPWERLPALQLDAELPSRLVDRSNQSPVVPSSPTPRDNATERPSVTFRTGNRWMQRLIEEVDGRLVVQLLEQPDAAALEWDHYGQTSPPRCIGLASVWERLQVSQVHAFWPTRQEAPSPPRIPELADKLPKSAQPRLVPRTLLGADDQPAFSITQPDQEPPKSDRHDALGTLGLLVRAAAKAQRDKEIADLEAAAVLVLE